MIVGKKKVSVLVFLEAMTFAMSLSCNETFSHVAATLSPSENAIFAPWSVILGGRQNTVLHSFSSIVAGSHNYVVGPLSTVIGGENNTAMGTAATIVSSSSSRVVGQFSLVLAGENSSANGFGSVAIGPAANAVHNSSGVMNFDTNVPRHECSSQGVGTFSVCVGSGAPNPKPLEAIFVNGVPLHAIVSDLVAATVNVSNLPAGIQFRKKNKSRSNSKFEHLFCNATMIPVVGFHGSFAC